MKRQKNLKRKMNTRGKIVLILFAILCVYVVSVFGRYVIERFHNSFASSREFYFTSNILTRPQTTYEFANWNGKEPYELAIDLYNKQNDFLSVDYDIKYDINCSVNNTSKATCSLLTNSSTSYTGVIYHQNIGKATHVIQLVPTANIKYGDTIVLTVIAKATEPYQKEISAKFNIKVGSRTIGYSVEDNAGDLCAELLINNSAEIYIVNEAFTDDGQSYAVDTTLTVGEYKDLTAENQAKCIPESKDVTVKFDPSIVRLDLASNAYQKCDQTKTKVKTVDESGTKYIYEITFPIEALSSELIRFYKLDPTKDYTYPGAATAIATVTTTDDE